MRSLNTYFLKVGDYIMAYFFHSEINAIAKCESYDHLTSLVAYGICRNTVTQLVSNIIEAIDRLDVNSDFNYFIDCMSNIYTGYAYTEAFNSILRHFANKVATFWCQLDESRNTQVDSCQIQENGRLNHWPEHMFDQFLLDSEKLL